MVKASVELNENEVEKAENFAWGLVETFLFV
jgi:hypothetical protein